MLAPGLVNRALNKSGIIRPRYLFLLKNILPHLHPRAEKGSLAWECPHPGSVPGAERSVCPAVQQRRQTHPFTLLTPKVCALKPRCFVGDKVSSRRGNSKMRRTSEQAEGWISSWDKGIPEGFEKNRSLCRMGEKGEELKDNRRLLSSSRLEVTRVQARQWPWETTWGNASSSSAPPF